MVIGKLIIRPYLQDSYLYMYSTQHIQADSYKHTIQINAELTKMFTSYKTSNITWCEKYKEESIKEKYGEESKWKQEMADTEAIWLTQKQ